MNKRPYTPIVKAGNLYFVSGQVGIDPESGAVPSSFEEQFAQACTNLFHVLDTENLSIREIVKTTVFLTSMDNYTLMNQLYSQQFGDHLPARSCVAVAELPRIGNTPLMVELEAIATKASK